MKLTKIKYRGEQNDTYKANAYALKCMYVIFVALFFCWILDVLNIFIVDLTIMNIATASAAIICAISFLYAIINGIDNYVSSYVIMFLLVLMVTAICTELAYHTTLLLIFPLVCSAQYFDNKISLFTAVTICAGCACAVLVGYHIGLCDSNMLLLTYTNSAYHSASLLSGDFTINNDISLMFLFFVFPKWLVVFAMMPLLNHVAKDIQVRTSREAMARHLAEVDGLTGIYNRTKYLQGISTYYPTLEKVGVLFFDVNNLKIINDTKGHELGDILICGLADALKENETETIKSYRIGGDEFVMIIDNADAASVKAKYNEMEELLQGKQLDQNLTLSVAIGMAFGKGKNIENLVKEADENMYKEKEKMKNA